MRPLILAVAVALGAAFTASSALAQDAVERAFREALAVTPTPTTLRLEQDEWRAQWTEYADERADLEQSRIADLERAVRRHGAIRAARPSLSDLAASCIDTGFDGCAVQRTGTLVLPDETVLHFQAQSGSTEDTGVSEAIVVLQSEGERLRPVLWLFGPLGVLDPEVHVSHDETGTPMANGAYVALPAYGQGTGHHWMGTLFRWNGADAPPTEIDAQSWLDDLALALPPGLGVWKGPGFQWEYLTAQSPLWQDNDGNCCPTGGDVGIDLKVEGDRLVLANVSVNDAVLTVAQSVDPAVLEWVARQQQCQHWMGEEPYDADRGAQINAMIARLRCDTVDGEEEPLRAEHAGDATVIALLDRARGQARQ
jgi:hypothetical protein